MKINMHKQNKTIVFGDIAEGQCFRLPPTGSNLLMKMKPGRPKYD